MDITAFIWDMDGTLVDSYPAIVPATQAACAEFGLNLSPDVIHEQIIRTSVGSFLEGLAIEHGLDPAPIKARFQELNDSRIAAINAIPHAAEVLEALKKTGHRSFVYTHRGASCRAILEQTGLIGYFTEIVTALDGFPRKPAPDAIIYLMKKYDLDSKRCYYVGDRSLDIEAAVNAGIGSILFLDPSSPGAATGQESLVVSDLLEIRERFCSSSLSHPLV